MSDDAAIPAPASVSASPIPLVLPEGFQPAVAAPALDPALRQALLGVGVQIGMLMMQKGTTPEDVAAKVGLPADLVFALMTGREPDVGIRSLDTVAKYLGGRLVIQLTLPPPAASAPPSA